MIRIDGSKGEGGGQVLRSALALSMVTSKPFVIENIRGGRKKPGLLRQHLTGVEAATKISNAECSDVELGSGRLEFHPGQVGGGNFRFAVGTAGSAILVLQTILPALMLADETSTIIVEGGTHAKAAPPFEFFERCFLPLVNRMGPKVSARLLQHGFFPAGGGRVEMQVEPVKSLQPFDLMERGELVSKNSHVLVSGIGAKVAHKENHAAKELLDWEQDSFSFETIFESRGPGNIQMISADFEHVSEMVSGFGEMGVPAFRIGKKTANRMKGFLESEAAVGPALADQLLLPMALAGGGKFTTVKPSEHSRTNAEIIGLFTDAQITFEQQDDGAFLVSIALPE